MLPEFHPEGPRVITALSASAVLSSGPSLDLLAVILMTNVKLEFFSAKIPAIITIFRSKKSTILKRGLYYGTPMLGVRTLGWSSRFL